MTRHREFEQSEVARGQPGDPRAMAHVAHVPIRNRGTVVGSLCHADAAAEMPMVLVLTGGSVVAEGRASHDRGLFQLHMTMAREPGEIIVEAHSPVLPARRSTSSPPPRRLCHRRDRRYRRLRQRRARGSRSIAACGIPPPVRLREPRRASWDACR
jgi:CO/xanthine dehydrogenase FAD-binding subunit